VFAVAALLPIPPEKIRSLTFLSLVGANVALIFVNRTFTSSLRAALGRPNPMLAWGLCIVTVVMLTVYCWPQVREFFGLAALTARDAIFCLGGSAALLLILEYAKRPWRRRLAA
jgi:P-type Ca2+ transporter type 2C